MLLESSALCLLENGIVCEEWEECEKREGEADGGPSFKMWKWKWQAWQGSINNARTSQHTSLL